MQGITSVLWRNTFNTVGDAAVHLGVSFNTVGDTFSIVEVVQYGGDNIGMWRVFSTVGKIF